MLEMYEKYTNVIRGIVKGDPPPQNRKSGMAMQHINMDYLYMYNKYNV